MKRCPRCEKSYADSETFCEDDGTALVNAGPAFAESAAASSAAGDEGQIECPVCGGKAQPGELICNFCGARLTVDQPSQPGPSTRPRISTGPGAQPPRTASMPPRDASRSAQSTGRMPGAADEDDESSGAGILGTLGYVAAAIIALGGGAWLALHLSSKNAAAPVAVASPAAPAESPSAVPTGPLVALTNSMGVQVTGESASAPERNQDAARKYFESRKGSLLDSYSHSLAGDSTLRDAMVVRVRILPSGIVDEASVRTSTNSNPGLDAEIVKDVMAWNYPAFSGSQVEVDYPIIFTNDPSTRDALESQLSSKLAGLSPTEAPEYASSPAPATPAAAASAAPVETPAAEAVEPAPPPVVRKRAPAPRRPVPPPTPTLTLQQQVKLALSSNPKLRRTDCYTSGSTVTIFGKVFDANDKALAERVVSRVPGVGNVVDSLTTDEADWAARQGRIAQQLANAGLNSVTIKVIGPDAFLGGTVKSDAQKQQAVTITESAAPVQVRTNLITVEPGNMFGF